jgi:hypothetical protein
MHSFTSVSKIDSTRAIRLLLMGLLLYFGALEVVARFGFTRRSQIQERVTRDYRTALALQPTTPDNKKTILVVGNSLLVHGIDQQKLGQKMMPTYSVALFPIENTRYLDWYFGMRRFFLDGARPSILVLSLSPRQLISNGTAGEYFAHYMMREPDILLVKREARLDTTMASEFFFANQSSWLGSRSSIRNWLLETLMPNIVQLTKYLPQNSSPMPPEDVVVREALVRLKTMQRLCQDHDARFLLLIPPLRETDRSSEAIKVAAERAGIDVLLPYRNGELPAIYFQDGFHLNEHGAALFTDAAGVELLKAVSKN